VTSRQLPAANARIELARTVAFASGPALGGVLVGWVGAAPAFGFAAALSVIAVVLLSGIHEPARTPAARRHPLQEIREGAAFVLHHQLLRPVFITQFIFNTASFLLLAVFVPYAVRHLGLSATGVGVTLGMYGVGMVVGALAATRVMARLAFGTVIGLGPVTGFVAAAVVAGARLRHQHHELWRPPARLGAGCHRRRTLWRGSLSLSGSRDLRRAGTGDLDFARRLAGAAAGHGGRAGAVLAGKPSRHCEERSDEAIHSLRGGRDCFLCFAMTVNTSNLFQSCAAYWRFSDPLCMMIII
jgi:MFS family permease